MVAGKKCFFFIKERVFRNISIHKCSSDEAENWDGSSYFCCDLLYRIENGGADMWKLRLKINKIDRKYLIKILDLYVYWNILTQLPQAQVSQATKGKIQGNEEKCGFSSWSKLFLKLSPLLTC